MSIVLKEITYNEEAVYQQWENLKNNLPDTANESDINVTEGRIIKALNRSFSKGSKGLGSVFLIATRDSSAFDYGDTAAWLPALRHVEHRVREGILDSLPPFEVAVYRRQGDIVGSVVSIPWSIDQMKRLGQTEAVRQARSRIEETCVFLHETLNPGVIALSGLMPAMTKHGSFIEELHPEINVTNGHAATTHLIGETVRRVSEETGLTLKEAVIGINGAGSIGTASAINLIREVKGFAIYDPIGARSSKLAEEITRISPPAVVKIENSGVSLLENSDLTIGAGSNLYPVFDRRSIPSKCILVDDAQPVSVKREDIEGNGGIVVWPIAKLPSNIVRVGFDYGPNGVMPDTDFGCAMEALIIGNGNINNRINCRVTPGDISIIGQLIHEAGFSTSDPLQSFARPVPDEQWENFRHG